MKKQIKTIRFFSAMILAAGLSLCATACKKDGTGSLSASATVTEADAAEMTTDAITPATGGMVTQLNSSVTIYKTVSLSCGVQKDSAIIKSSISGATPSYNYSLSWNYMLTCNGIIPVQLAFNFSGAANYGGLRMSSTDNSTGGFLMTGLQLSSAQYLFNATYKRTGTTISKIGNQNTFNSTITITGASIAIDKSSLEIVSGSASVNISATSSSGKSFTFNGSITFLGSKKANLVLNSGVSYVIQWT